MYSRVLCLAFICALNDNLLIHYFLCIGHSWIHLSCCANLTLYAGSRGGIIFAPNIHIYFILTNYSTNILYIYMMKKPLSAQKVLPYILINESLSVLSNYVWFSQAMSSYKGWLLWQMY